MNITKNWDEIPIGTFLFRAYHKSLGDYTFQLMRRIDDEEWFDQELFAFPYSESASKDNPMWTIWKSRLPVFDYYKTI